MARRVRRGSRAGVPGARRFFAISASRAYHAQPADASLQYLFVNGRLAKDWLLLPAIRGAYQDFMPRGAIRAGRAVPDRAGGGRGRERIPPRPRRFPRGKPCAQPPGFALHEAPRRGASVRLDRWPRTPRPLRKRSPPCNTAPLFTPQRSFIPAQQERPLSARKPRSRIAARQPEQLTDEPLGTARAQLTKPTSSPKPRTASCSWTSTPPTSASSTRS
jgi:hypothetical protein